MSWRVLVSAPYMLPVLEEFRPRLEREGVEVFAAAVRERLSEEELLPLVAEIDGALCGDDQFTERVMRSAPRLKVISKWGTGIDSIDTGAAARLGIRVCHTPDACTDPVADTTLGYSPQRARSARWRTACSRRITLTAAAPRARVHETTIHNLLAALREAG